MQVKDVIILDYGVRYRFYYLVMSERYDDQEYPQVQTTVTER